MNIETGGEVLATNIPEEIVVEILVRLPPKSLLRFRSVSKTWKDLIDSPAFINHHLNEFVSTDQCHLINFHHDWDHWFATPTIYCNLLSGQTKQVIDLDQGPPCLDGPHLVNIHGSKYCKADFPESDDRHGCFQSSILGPVNGVYCIVIQGFSSSFGCTLVLWNPGNRQAHVPPPLPRFPLSPSLEEDLKDISSQFEVCGIGYDDSSSSNKLDLKIILCTVCNSFHVPRILTFFHLYSLSTNSWQPLDPFDIIPDHYMIKMFSHGEINFVDEFDLNSVASREGVCFNGATHWLNVNYFCEPLCILSFDFECQAFKTICTPKYAVLFGGKPPTLKVFTNLKVVNGCLALVLYLEMTSDTTAASVFHVWVMREYNVEDSWTRAYQIKLTQGPGRFIGIVDDEFFVQEADENGRVFSYRLNVHEPIEEHCGYGSFGDQIVRIFPYKRSLVRIKP